MYRKKLVLAFASLFGLMLIQAGVAFWLFQTVQQHEKRSVVAENLLVSYTDLSADKQRLKVWYAQLLLTGDAPAEARDLLLTRIDGHIRSLRTLSELQARLLDQSDTPAPAMDHKQTLDVLQNNFSNFRQRVVQTQAERQASHQTGDKEQIWRDVLAIFDMAGTQDVRVLIAGAIKQQARISQQAEDAAEATIKRSNQVLVAMVALTSAITLVMAWYFASKLKRPIDDLLLGTQRVQSTQFDPAHPISVPQRSQDEFGQLAGSFNSMAQEIYNTRLLEKARNEILELAVRERTAELMQANEALQSADGHRRQFFADLSHELRTPTTAILGEAEIALRGKQKSIEDYRFSLNNIASTTRQLSQRISELLLLAREQTLSDHVQLASLPLAPILQEAVAQARSLAQGSEVVVDGILDSSPGGAHAVLTDAAKLHQVLMVLYDNAVRYTPGGGRVSTQVSDLGGAVEVSIVDTGIGLDATEEAEVFKRNFRGVNARKMRSDGAGLGLAIAQTLAEAIGADIGLQRQAGGGCRAVVRLTKGGGYVHPGR